MCIESPHSIRSVTIQENVRVELLYIYDIKKFGTLQKIFICPITCNHMMYFQMRS